MNETVKSITLGRLRENATRAYLSRGLRPPIDGGEPRHGVRPRETRPEQPAERNRRRGGRWGRRSKPL